MPVQIQLRNDTAANWIEADPVLAAGEMGVESDTLKVKLGDGSSSWTELLYFTQGATGPTGPAVTGPTGPTGAASTVVGPTGPTGPTGPQAPLTISTLLPTSGQGTDGDLWIVYS